jgi:Uma2 family endonuclease
MAEILERKITVKEFRAMEFPENDYYIYELINGIIMKKAAPKPIHQFVVRRLSKAFENYLDQNPIGEFLTSPIDVFFDDNSQTQPDLLFIKKERDFIVDLDEGIMGAPDLIVEILSPGSYKADKIDKKNLYERFGVKEYWIIDPNNKVVEAFVMNDNAYVMQYILENDGQLASTVLTGFTVDIKILFD